MIVSFSQYKNYYIWTHNNCIEHIRVSDKNITNCLCGQDTSNGGTSRFPVKTPLKECLVCKNLYIKLSDKELLLCNECGFDHAVQPDQTYNAHMNILAKRVAKRCIDFSRTYRAVSIRRYAIDIQVRKEVRDRSATLNPISISDKVCLILKNEGIGVKHEEKTP